MQQTCRYRSIRSIFTRISSRVFESERAYNLANLHASNLAKLVENILKLERKGDKEKEYELSTPIEQTSNNKMESEKESNFSLAKGLKKREGSPGRRRLKGNLEKALAKIKKKANNPSQSEPPVRFICLLTNHFIFNINAFLLKCQIK